MIYKFFSVFILLFVLNCKSTQEYKNMDDATLVLISKGNLYGAGAEGIHNDHFIIYDEKVWNSLLQKMNTINTISDSFSETKIDFSKYTVIAVFDEVKSSGGYGLALEIIKTSDKIEVNVIKKSPQGPATSVMTQPYCIVKIQNTELPIIVQ